MSFLYFHNLSTKIQNVLHFRTEGELLFHITWNKNMLVPASYKGCNFGIKKHLTKECTIFDGDPPELDATLHGLLVLDCWLIILYKVKLDYFSALLICQKKSALTV